MKYALVTIINDDYMIYGYPMIKSFVTNNKWFTGDIVCIYDDELIRLSEGNRNRLKELYSNIVFHKCDPSTYSKVIAKHWDYLFNKGFATCFFKYEIFGMTEYDKILYLDADIIVNDSIEELFQLNDDFIAGEDWGQSTEYIQHTNQKFNAGVMFFGSKYFLNEKTKEDVIDYSINHSIAFFAEQTILNNYFSKHNIPRNYRFFPCIYNFAIINEPLRPYTYKNNSLVDKVKIFHYWHKPYIISEHEKVRQIFNKYL